MNIYGLNKYVKNSKEDSREENLLTGILSWALERNTELISEIITNAVGLEKRDEVGQSLSNKLRGIILEDDISVEFQKFLKSTEKAGVVDVGIYGDEFVILGESKVVPKELTSEQIQRYYLAALNIFPKKAVYIICITPDNHEHILRIFNEIYEKYRDKFYWLSWRTIWEICDRMLEKERENIALKEVKEAIIMAGLKPFGGFSKMFLEIMDNIHELELVYDFFEACERTLTDSKGLDLKSGSYRCSLATGRIYPEVIYRYYWNRKWETDVDPNNHCFCIEFFYEEVPRIRVSLWFPRGRADDNFMEIQEIHESLLDGIRNKFPGYEVKFDDDQGHFFGIVIKIKSSEEPANLINEIEEIVNFLNNDTFQKIEEAGYSFI